jgi:hypothetical protein
MFFYNRAWPQYKLENGQTWPINRNLRFNNIPQLGLF